VGSFYRPTAIDARSAGSKRPACSTQHTIVGDVQREGEATVTNGLSLCSIHHRAYDENLVGVSPDYQVRVSRRLLEEDDGPMLDVLKTFDQQSIHLPARRAHYPDRERLATRFERFD
jgi:putative restriction endonuclease